MAQPRVIEVDYYILLDKIKQASNAKSLVEKTNSEQWKKYVKDNAIRDTSLQAYGKVKFMAGKPKMVGIVMGDAEWDGCYVYSSEDEAALKYVPG